LAAQPLCGRDIGVLGFGHVLASRWGHSDCSNEPEASDYDGDNASFGLA
jgi:hypothetical protein